jgi:1-acyl-sn-glycerol-3-phosphate acyltransferase
MFKDDFIQGIVKDSLALDEEVLMESTHKTMKTLRRFSKPVLTGSENIPEGPVLFVGNHSTMATDVAVALPMLNEASDRVVRGMNDRMFYQNPKVRKWVIGTGGVMGHPEIGAALFEAGKSVLVFPGGAFEANKNLDLRYTIQWKQRTGFVRLAARHGVPIVPVGIVGPDEWYDRYMDRDEVRDSVFGRMLLRAGVSQEYLDSDSLPPIPKGFMGTLIPKRKQVFIHIGKPISTRRFKGKNISQASQNKLRDQSKERLEDAIQQMLSLREQRSDGKRNLLNWWKRPQQGE